MPIVSVNLTAGRDDTVKSFIARSVVDAVAELAGV
jgi:phenylpyruvate tautomerase PptA (4-oxalocrotonate tautomerase family)